MKDLVNKFSMLDDALKRHIFSLGLASVFMLLCGIYFGLAYQSMAMLFFFLIIFLLMCLFAYYRLMLCIEEKIVFADGEIVEIYNASLTKKKLGRNYLLIKQEDAYIKVYYHKVRKFKENNLVRLYFTPDSLISENRDTYVCNSIFLISKTRTRA